MARAARAARPAGRGPGETETAEAGLLLATAALASLGVVMSFSATAPLALGQTLPPHFLRHCATLGVGVAVAFGVAHVRPRLLHAVALPAWAAGVALLAATHAFGVEVNGARRWLAVPGLGMRFQPVEVAKLATLLAVVWTVHKEDVRGRLEAGRTLRAALLVLPPVALLLRQPDLGNAALLCVLAALVVCVAGARWRDLALGGALGLAGAVAFVLRSPYALRRLTGFLDPYATAGDEGFQLVQSFAAFGNGGLWGAGLGDGRQKLFYLPEAHTDFILALIAEELGLVGVWLVLAAFAALLLFGLRIARRAPDRFGLLVAVAMTSLLTVPALVNAAVVMGLLPTKGLTLPFLSYGRTSLVACCAATGVLLGVARRSGAAPRGRAREGGSGRWR